LPPSHDPMIVRMIAWDDTRRQGDDRRPAALGGARVAGIPADIPFRAELMCQPVMGTAPARCRKAPSNLTQTWHDVGS